MSKGVAFICPLYDMKNHFDLAFNLYKSKIDLDINEDIYFVFSDEVQKEKFSKRIEDALKKEIAFLILPPEEVHYKSKVTVKKFFALRSLMSDYDYLSVIDSESLFVKKVDFSNLFENIWRSRTFLNSNISPDGFPILRACFRTLSPQLYNNKKLRKEFDNYKYNFWFNEIPVYKCSTLPSFFKWLDSFDPNGYKNELNCFEYYIYGAYLILFEGMHLNKFPELVSNGGVMEYLFEKPVAEQISIVNQLGTHWSSSKDAITDSIVMLFHLDRTHGEGYYAFGLDEEYIKKMKTARIHLMVEDYIIDYLPGGSQIVDFVKKLIH